MPAPHDIAYDASGAAWFSDPVLLFPLVRERLVRGGESVGAKPLVLPSPEMDRHIGMLIVRAVAA